MIRSLRLFRGTGFDPYANLAVEQCLLEQTESGCCTLYLWQNQNTVVIGRNQNALRECRVGLLSAEGGRLARRLSGGGAVFHDLGNLNFTFLLPAEDYDLSRQLGVLERACRALGVPAERSGRNDLLADGRKFSGNAFYRSGQRAYHHGTLLVCADLERMRRYLSPSAAKLDAKGVASVRARVANLREFSAELTVPALEDALIAAFEEVYGQKASELDVSALSAETLEAYRQRNASSSWLFGERGQFSFSCEARFAWGEIQLHLRPENGRIARAEVCTDAMDWSLAPRLERALTGVPFSLAEMENAIRSVARAEELCRMLREAWAKL